MLLKDNTFLCKSVTVCGNPTLAVTSCCRSQDLSSPSPAECGWGFYPHKAEEAAVWTPAPGTAAPSRACSRGECTICIARCIEICPNHTGRYERCRRTMSGIPTWTGKQKNKERSSSWYRSSWPSTVIGKVMDSTLNVFLFKLFKLRLRNLGKWYQIFNLKTFTQCGFTQGFKYGDVVAMYKDWLCVWWDLPCWSNYMF